MDCSVTQARELIGNAKLWPKVKAYLVAGGEFELFPAKDPSRLKLVDGSTRAAIGKWLEALAAADGWRKIVDGSKVRELKAEYPGVYPDVFRYTAYFAKWRDVLEGMARSASERGNPNQPQNEVVIPERAVVKFRAGKELKDAVEKLNPADFND